MTCWLNIYGEANKAWLMSKPKKRMRVLRRTARYTRWDHKRNDILTELQISQITELIYQYRKKLKRACWQDPKNDSKIPTKREKKFRKTFEKVEGFSFVTPATGLSRPNTGKEDDDDDLRNVLHLQLKKDQHAVALFTYLMFESVPRLHISTDMFVFLLSASKW
jgi:hypothetical protein